MGLQPYGGCISWAPGQAWPSWVSPWSPSVVLCLAAPQRWGHLVPRPVPPSAAIKSGQVCVFRVAARGEG